MYSNVIEVDTLGVILISAAPSWLFQGKKAQSPAYNLPMSSELCVITKYSEAVVDVFLRYIL